MCVYDMQLDSMWGLWVEHQLWLLPFELILLNLIVLSGSTSWWRIINEENILQANQFLMIIEWAYSQLGNLPCALY